MGGLQMALNNRADPTTNNRTVQYKTALHMAALHQQVLRVGIPGEQCPHSVHTVPKLLDSSCQPETAAQFAYL